MGRDTVDAKIEEQQKFVAWWQGNVSIGESRRANRVPGSLKLSEAERLTGMKQQRVSDLGKCLTDLVKFRLRLLGAEYRAACLEGADNVRGTRGIGEFERYTPSNGTLTSHLAAALMSFAAVKRDSNPSTSAFASMPRGTGVL